MRRLRVASIVEGHGEVDFVRASRETHCGTGVTLFERHVPGGLEANYTNRSCFQCNAAIASVADRLRNGNICIYFDTCCAC